jgi:acetolactate synthase-1/2/3 large subunit
VLLLGGRALRADGLRAAARIAAATGARLVSETFPARLERGQGIPSSERLPYFPEQAVEALSEHDALVLAGARDPVAFFGYPDTPSRLAPPGVPPTELCPDDADPAAALHHLADALAAPPPAAPPAATLPDAPRDGPVDPVSLGATLARAQPAEAVVVDEGATSSLFYGIAAAAAPPHATLTLTGGAIGQALPVAVGAAIACPDRRVIALQADGGGLYTLQALWTMAREGLDVTSVICANRQYRILQIELGRAGIAEPGPNARSLTDLTHPVIDWAGLGRSFGVPSVRVETNAELASALARSLAEPGPNLIEVVL